MSHPDALPELFLDRSLGRIKVPTLLRAAGLRLTTLSEHYGIPADETVPDEQWLELAGTSDWAVFMKDTRIRYYRAEREAVRTHRVKCFCLSSQSLTGGEMAARFLEAWQESLPPEASPDHSSTPSTRTASRDFPLATDSH